MGRKVSGELGRKKLRGQRKIPLWTVQARVHMENFACKPALFLSLSALPLFRSTKREKKRHFAGRFGVLSQNNQIVRNRSFISDIDG